MRGSPPSDRGVRLRLVLVRDGGAAYGELMRIYLPATMGALGVLVSRERLDGPHTAYAVTAAAADFTGYGETALGHTARQDAAFASLRQLYVDGSGPRRRVVIAADVPDEAVTPTPRMTAACAVSLSCAVRLPDVACVYADSGDAATAADIAAGAEAVPGVDLGVLDDEMLVAKAESHQMHEHARQDIRDLAD